MVIYNNMRDIEFRALTEVQPHLWFKYGYFYEECNYWQPTRSLIRDKNWECYYINKETLWQFTWLLDKNWVKIFEWDILAHQTYKYEVKWNNKQSSFMAYDINNSERNFDLFCITLDTHKAEIINNINKYETNNI